MNIRTILASLSLFLVSFATAYAQVGPAPTGGSTGDIGGSTLSQYLLSFIGFIDRVLVPLVFAVAFVVFIWGIFQYFIAGGANEEQRDKGKQLAVWGIIALFIMVSVWGLVRLLMGTFNFSDTTRPPLPTFQQASQTP